MVGIGTTTLLICVVICVVFCGVVFCGVVFCGVVCGVVCGICGKEKEAVVLDLFLLWAGQRVLWLCCLRQLRPSHRLRLCDIDMHHCIIASLHHYIIASLHHTNHTIMIRS